MVVTWCVRVCAERVEVVDRVGPVVTTSLMDHGLEVEDLAGQTRGFELHGIPRPQRLSRLPYSKSYPPNLAKGELLPWRAESGLRHLWLSPPRMRRRIFLSSNHNILSLSLFFLSSSSFLTEGKMLAVSITDVNDNIQSDRCD